MGKPSSSFQYRRMVAVPLIAGNGWRYVVGLPCMDYRVTNTAYGKLKYTACCVSGAVKLVET